MALEPIEPSKRSPSPRCEATERSERVASQRDSRLAGAMPGPEAEPSIFHFHAEAGWAIRADALRAAPAVSRKLRSMSTIFLPRQRMTSRASAVTVAITAALRFSALAAAMNAGASFARTTTAMRSCDSDMASSVPLSPSYFLGTASRSMSRPGESSPTATATPPAPKSLQRRIRRVTDGSRKSRWILRSSTALPFWTSAPAVVTDSFVWALDDPVAPPMPSRPVPPPTMTTRSPASGSSRTTEVTGVAAMTAPSSMRLARKPGS